MSLGRWPVQNDDKEDHCEIERDDREEGQPGLLHETSIRAVPSTYKAVPWIKDI